LLHSFPSVELVAERVLFFDAGNGVEHKLADVGEDGSVAGRDAALGQGNEEFAEDIVDIGGGHESTGDGGGDFGAEALGFEELHLVVGVEKAKRGVALVTEHAAFAAVGELKLAKMRIVGSGTFSGHLMNLWGEVKSRESFER
jgi:hypothetical protein